MILNFGKYSGYDIRNVPRDYLEWLIERGKKDLAGYSAELERRDLAEAAQLSMAEQIVQTGYRTLAQKFHPDKGGCREVQRACCCE
jgi:hypothetical protein